MLLITVYTVLDDVVVTIDSMVKGELDHAAPANCHSLHYSANPIDHIQSPDDLARMIANGLSHSDGYAGDLHDHVTR